jgi:hypothetical protein
MPFLVVEAYLKLIQFDLYLVRQEFAALYEKVRSYPVCPQGGGVSVERLCSAVDTACLWYSKDVLCLQRSAATVCLLRRHGFSAKMVLGAQQMPFKAHAWVEVGDLVVNDKPYVPEIYAILDRC